MTSTKRLGASTPRKPLAGSWLLPGLLALSGSVYACGSASADLGFGAQSEGPNAEAERADGGALEPGTSAGSPDLAPVDNAVILVHAAKAQPFRLCFDSEAELDRRPLPDSQVMPEANVVGVEVGTAVRLGPLNGAPGQVYLFEEPLIRALYPQFGGNDGANPGPTCRTLLTSPTFKGFGVALGAPITRSLATGVHLLVVKGCAADTPLRKYSLEECGPGWTAGDGNLDVQAIPLAGANRPNNDSLPVQVVNLSQPLELARAGRDVVVSFGDLDAGGPPHAPVVSNPPLFAGAAPPSPATVTYASNDTAIYDTVGFRVQLVARTDGGSPPATVLEASLARIQKQSSSRDVPTTYYAAASNYALLLLGDPDARLTDGGADEDPRRNLHLLAVPVIGPKADAGSEPGGGEPLDGGSGP